MQKLVIGWRVIYGGFKACSRPCVINTWAIRYLDTAARLLTGHQRLSFQLVHHSRALAWILLKKFSPANWRATVKILDFESYDCITADARPDIFDKFCRKITKPQHRLQPYIQISDPNDGARCRLEMWIRSQPNNTKRTRPPRASTIFQHD